MFSDSLICAALAPMGGHPSELLPGSPAPAQGLFLCKSCSDSASFSRFHSQKCKKHVNRWCCQFLRSCLHLESSLSRCLFQVPPLWSWGEVPGGGFAPGRSVNSGLLACVLQSTALRGPIRWLLLLGEARAGVARR